MATLLKDLYHSDFIASLANRVHECYSPFDPHYFSNLVFDSSWDARPLKDRMHHIAQCLHQCLPDSYPESLAILQAVSKTYEETNSFTLMLFPDFVEQFGVSFEHWELSMKALEFFTRSSSSEFAIRPFIILDPKRAMAQCLKWAQDENVHVRRLASEGCRPRLPWGMQLGSLIEDPSPIIPILECLKDDPEEYVRRSVANNLNDISKDHPQLVCDVATKWYGASKNRNRLVKHACRTLLKKGTPEMMVLFGFGGDIGQVELSNLTIAPDPISIGQKGLFSFDLHLLDGKPQLIRLEYAIYFLKASGSHSKKVFQLSEKMIERSHTTFTKSHSFEDRSVRKHYSGRHTIAIIVNGHELTSLDFQLT